MRDGICVNALHMILLIWEMVFSECSLYDNIEMGDSIYLIAIYVILIKWETVYVWKQIVWCY